MRCSDCHYLYNAWPTGRNPQSCSDLGEEPQFEICDRFKPRGSNPRLPLAPTEIQFDPTKPVDYEHRAEFTQLMGEQLQIERDVHATIKDINDQFFLDGVNTSFDDRSFKRVAARLVDLRLLHLLCGQLELVTYRSAIMAGEIERLFGTDHKQALELIKEAEKVESDYARVLRVPNAAPGTAVGSKTRRKARVKK